MGLMSNRGERTLISMSRLSSSARLTGRKRGSWSAAAAAHSATVRTKGLSASTWPMQPRSDPRTRRVTKAPALSTSAPESSAASGKPRPAITSAKACRATLSRIRPCSSASGNIFPFSLLLGALKHYHAIHHRLFQRSIQFLREVPEVKSGGDQGRNYHQPQQHRGRKCHDREPPFEHDGRDGGHLQHHLGLAEIGGLQQESFARGDRPQARDGEFPADDDH